MDLPEAPLPSGSPASSHPTPADPSPWAIPAPTPSALIPAGSAFGVPPSQPSCAICGCVPARQVEYRQGIGMLFLRRTKTMRVVACRDCGVALFRKMQSATLLTGWWGMISFFLNLGTLWSNYKERRTLDELEAPRQPAARTTQTPRTAPLPLGSPSFLRPQALGAVGALLVVLLLLGVVGGDRSTANADPPVSVGTCGTIDSGRVRYPVDCGDAKARVQVVAVLPSGSTELDCPATARGSSVSPTYGTICWSTI